MEDNQTKILKFRGLLNRMMWWPLAISLALVSMMMEFALEMPDITFSASIVALVVSIIVAYIHIAINKARLNEAGWSGWWMLVPILNVVVMGFFPPVESKYSK